MFLSRLKNSLSNITSRQSSSIFLFVVMPFFNVLLINRSIPQNNAYFRLSYDSGVLQHICLSLEHRFEMYEFLVSRVYQNPSRYSKMFHLMGGMYIEVWWNMLSHILKKRHIFAIKKPFFSRYRPKPLSFSFRWIS